MLRHTNLLIFQKIYIDWQKSYQETEIQDSFWLWPQK